MHCTLHSIYQLPSFSLYLLQMEPFFDEQAVENLRAAFIKVKLAVLFFLYYCSDSVGGIVIWLAPWVGKMNQILYCNWAKWSYLAHSGLPAMSSKKFAQNPYNKSSIDQVCLVKMAGYWPHYFCCCCCCCCEFMDLDSISVHKHAKKKKNLANIQPSWPRTWSITHTGICWTNYSIRMRWI